MTTTNDSRLYDSAHHVRSAIDNVQQVIFSRHNNEEYYDTYYDSLREALKLLFDVESLDGYCEFMRSFTDKPTMFIDFPIDNIPESFFEQVATILEV